MKPQLIALVIAACLATTNKCMAQDGQPDPLVKFIRDMVQMHQGRTLCIDESLSPQAVRSNVVNYLRDAGKLGNATGQTVATAIWTLYPCPFSPSRPELRAATASDIEGAWLFPEASQKLRFAPRSPQKSPAGPVPVTCDAIGYFPHGELRHAISAGQVKCPFEKASDMDASRKNPRVSNWALLRDGRIGVSRTDVANHIEEWDIFIVTIRFSSNDVQFSVGDLVSYIRRENGNEFGAATQFRHLKRLP